MKVRNYSRKREAILLKIQSTTCHPTAEWVFQELKDEFPDLSLGTVYRNIALFKADGLIKSVGTDSGKERFDGRNHPHGHFVCRICGEIFDFDLPQAGAGITAHLEQHNIAAQVEKIDIVVYGTCANC